MVISITSEILRGTKEDCFYVESQTYVGKYYKVTSDDCKCPDATFRGVICKYI
jgi:hypothetical protein